jgi:hypothetical protein
MGLTPPGDTVRLLESLGYAWPASDEDGLFAVGQEWIGFAAVAEQYGQAGNALAEQVTSEHRVDGVTAFHSYWSGSDGPGTVVAGNAIGAMLLGAGYLLVACALLVLKTAIQVQLALLSAQVSIALADAERTGGASLARIPVYRIRAAQAIRRTHEQVVTVILGSR